jgi:hypothetical protein
MQFQNLEGRVIGGAQGGRDGTPDVIEIKAELSQKSELGGGTHDLSIAQLVSTLLHVVGKN